VAERRHPTVAGMIIQKTTDLVDCYDRRTARRVAGLGVKGHLYDMELVKEEMLTGLRQPRYD
jgi:hypothetical protein